jgi:hypothetical protein
MNRLNIAVLLCAVAVVGGCQKHDEDTKKAQRVAAVQDSLSRPVCNAMHPCSK